MDDALIVLFPLHLWLAAQLPEHYINVCHRGITSAFKNTVGNASPAIAFRELHFYAVRPSMISGNW